MNPAADALAPNPLSASNTRLAQSARSLRRYTSWLTSYLLQPCYSTVIPMWAVGAVTSAFEIATTGGKHAGCLNNYPGRITVGNPEAAASIEKLVAEHRS
jgi:hypothetical protein